MGQAFSIATPTAGSAGIDVPEMYEFIYEKSMGNAQFMKSIRARHDDGIVLVKALVKPYTPMPLDKYSNEIIRQRNALAKIPNVLAFQHIIETETNGYLVRPFLYSSLYDRLSTRPFLEDIEKKWLAFQLLCALRDCHAKDIFHGDIKAQNVLVTSWNWLYLTDFSSAYKPTVLPEDNPADFSYFFDTSGKRTCYVAPERFLPAGESVPGNAKLGWAMDIFSVGCVIAQMFLETELFTLSQLYKYKRGEYDPTITALSSITDKDVRDMIAHMIQMDPEKRYTADLYLEFFRGKVFPDYFYTFLHQYMQVMTDVSSPVDNSSQIVLECYDEKKNDNNHVSEPDDRIDHVWNDLDKINYFLSGKDRERPGDDEKEKAPLLVPTSLVSSDCPSLFLGLTEFPVHLNTANRTHMLQESTLLIKEDDGTLIFLDLVTSSLRNTRRAAARIRACDVILALSERLTDESKLDRALPYLVQLLMDDDDLVMSAALRSITELVKTVTSITPINSHLFVEYLVPRIHQALKRNPSMLLLRVTYAACIGTLATTASRFLEMAATLQLAGTSWTKGDPEVESGNDDDQAAFDEMFDNIQSQLYAIFERHAKLLVEDSDMYVRRALLTSVPDLVLFFGPVESNDILLTHLYTYLNDKDWMLKCAFFDTVVGIAALIGATALQEFLLPLILQALADPEEFVVKSAIHALAQLASLGLLSRAKLWELVDVISRTTMHPNLWIRQASAEFISSACRYMSYADVQCIVAPVIDPYMKVYMAPRLAEVELLDLLKKPLSRPVFDQAVSWATNTDKGLFWKSFQKPRASSHLTVLGAHQAVRGAIPTALSRVPINDEDEQWISKLRNLGLVAEDEFKLLALREFIWRFAQAKASGGGTSSVSTPIVNFTKSSSLIDLQDLDIIPKTVFFDDPEEGSNPQSPLVDAGLKSPYTIADALMDASMTIDDSTKRGKQANGAACTVSRDGSGGGPSSTTAPRQEPRDNSDAASVSSNRRFLRPKTSALALLDRRDNKTAAETGTTETNAFGEVEGPFAPAATPILGSGSTPGTPALGSAATATTTTAAATSSEEPANTRKVIHSYNGGDPNILKMLKSVYLQNYPHDLVDFGPYVPAISSRKGMPVVGAPGTKWKPGNNLVAMFSEHTGPINKIAVSPDHRFFVTASDDGTAKVWDSQRLERNISQRSRQTYHHHTLDSRILALCFVEGSHCFVTCADDGSVHVVRTTITSGRYGKLKKLREFQLPAGEYVVWCEHQKMDVVSTLFIATNKSRILAVDLRVMSVLYVLENPIHHGMTTCFCIDRKRNWLVVGTSHGVIDLWDLRFRMRLKAWGIPGKTAIHRIAHHPARGHGKWICVAGGTGHGEVTTWDVERGVCKEIYRVVPPNAREGPKTYEAWDVDEDKPEGMLGRFATNIEPAADSEGGGSDAGVRAVLVGTGLSADGRDIKHAFMLTGGSDKKLRFWDMAVADNSFVYAGGGAGNPEGEDDEVRTEFRVEGGMGTTINVERGFRRAGEGKKGGRQRQRQQGGGRGNWVVSAEQRRLLKGHLDGVLDLAILDFPYPMSISGDRMGVVFVFQ